MVEIEVSEKGFIKIRNDHSSPVTIWKIEFTYAIYTTPIDKINLEDQRFARKLVTESVNRRQNLNPGEEFTYYSRLPRDSIKEVVVYFEENNIIKKEIKKFY